MTTSSINDPEYQVLRLGLIQPSAVYVLDRFEYKQVGEHEIFLPMDDDIWGSWLKSLDFFVEKVNFIENGKRYKELEEFYLINQFSSDEGKSSVTGVYNVCTL